VWDCACGRQSGWAVKHGQHRQPPPSNHTHMHMTLYLPAMYLVSWLTKRQTTHAGFIVKFNGASWSQVSAMLSRFSLTLPLSPRPAPSACTQLKRKLLPDAPAQHTHTGSEITFESTLLGAGWHAPTATQWHT
jgi:hypothetical protein